MSDNIKVFQRKQLSLDVRMNAVFTEAIRQEADDKGYELLEDPHTYYDGKKWQVTEAKGIKSSTLSDNQTSTY